MSDGPGHDPETLRRLVARLEEAAGSLRAGDLGAEEAAQVVEACAQQAAQASAELERLVRLAASEPMGSPRTQDQLL